MQSLNGTHHGSPNNFDHYEKTPLAKVLQLCGCIQLTQTNHGKLPFKIYKFY